MKRKRSIQKSSTPVVVHSSTSSTSTMVVNNGHNGRTNDKKKNDIVSMLLSPWKKACLRSRASPKDNLSPNGGLIVGDGEGQADANNNNKENMCPISSPHPLSKKQKLSIEVPPQGKKQSHLVRSPMSATSLSHAVVNNSVRRSLQFHSTSAGKSDTGSPLLSSSSTTSTDFDHLTFGKLSIESPLNTPLSSGSYSAFTPMSAPASPALISTRLSFSSPPQSSSNTEFASVERQEQEDISVNINVPQGLDFSSCATSKRNTGNRDKYFAISKPVSRSQKRKKNARFTAGLVLPTIPMEEDKPEISPLADISPGIFCEPTVFDDPNSQQFMLTLPVEPEPRNSDCNTISTETMVRVLRGEFGKFLIIDCRFPFEYDGGHFKSAVNITRPDCLKELLFDAYTSSDTNSLFLDLQKKFDIDSELLEDTFSNPKDTIIIFHCEYSQKRGPKLYRHLRHLDREAHRNSYPELYYPNMYVLEKGYKGFWEHLLTDDSFASREFCEPDNYVPMDDPQYKDDLTESWKQMRESWKKQKQRRR